MSETPVTLANHLVASGAIADGIALLTQAANAEDVDALMQLAVWRLVGQPVPRDLAAARALLRRAASIGHVDAALMEVALTANGSGGPPDWIAAQQLLRTAAAHDPVAASQLKLLDAMEIDAEGRPLTLPQPQMLVPGSHILRFPCLFTPEECAHVVSVAIDMLEPGRVVDPRTGRWIAHPIRTADEAAIGPAREDLVVQALNKRIAAASGTETGQGEPLTVLRYRPGQQFRLHSDVLPKTRNQRVATVLVYLNAGFEGGRTTFPAYRLEITPRQGDAVVFRNVDAKGAPDLSKRHSGEPVVRGTKWLATRWIRARTFSHWTGPEN
ncbi:MAG: 2OG-Fe(II) oxygenase [Sphingomonas sp.]